MMETQTDFILHVENVSKQYSGHKALDDVSISVKRGSIYALLGPNGAGKTSLIRIITRITAPDSGKVLFNGHPLKEDDMLKIGYLPEERGLYPKMKIGEQLLYFAQLKGMSDIEARKAIQYWFDVLDLNDWQKKKASELSKGMQQKVQFIASIIHKPDFIILDEPFSGFDPVNAEIIKKEILNLKNAGKTIILSTHRMENVEELCSSFCLINKSKKLVEGTVQEVKQRYKKNLFEIELNTNFEILNSDQINIISLDELSNGNKKITYSSSLSNNENISYFLNYGNLVSFNEKIPTVKDIFVNLVGFNQEINNQYD